MVLVKYAARTGLFGECNVAGGNHKLVIIMYLLSNWCS